MAYGLNIVDGIGNEHPRKNLYLKDLGLLEEKIASGTDTEKKEARAKRSELIRQKEKHPYIVAFKEFEAKEKAFQETLKGEMAKLKPEGNADIQKWKRELYQAEQEANFYSPYSDLSYEAELKSKVATIRMQHLPDMIENDNRLEALLKEKETLLAQEEKKDQTAVLQEIERYTTTRKEQLTHELEELNQKHKEGLISSKALKNERKIKRRSATEDIAAKELSNKILSLKEEIKNIRHHLKIDPKTQRDVLLADIADIRRKTPIEREKRKPIFAYSTAILPGLGQLLNKQYTKALFFFIGSLFIYFIAIPYAIGYGNYQGKGIFGLLSLAQGGLKTHRSMIFMIEGIIAIVLLVFSALIFILSFKDVYRVEKKEIQGIRKNLWFETKLNIEQEGFPYLVSLPAFLLITFVVLVPVMTTVLLSFTNMDPNHQNKFFWIGLENYKLIALGQGIAGGAFWLILGWTLIWTLCSTTLAIFIGFVLSLLTNQERIWGKRIFRTVFLLPWAVPAFITIMFFSVMLAPGGPLTDIISSLAGKVVNIKSDTHLTRIALIMLQGWLGSAYVFLISTGILQGIPSDLYEAAEIDGATGFQKTLKITIPLVLFQTGPLLVGQYTFNFNNFSIIYLFNQGGPFNPSKYGNLAGSSDLLISYIYKLTIENQYQGIGAAITLVISIALMFFAYLGFKNSKAFKED